MPSKVILFTAIPRQVCITVEFSNLFKAFFSSKRTLIKKLHL